MLQDLLSRSHGISSFLRPLDAEESWQQYLKKLRPHQKIHFADGTTSGTATERENGFSLF